ncbi:MAG TPA: 2-hydroxyglutaryl-CoA dehydratase [Pseudomonadota bacterium]|nr:2-hydroxyglutaryl-CoA dehydratase [Pseudomonadota bacterium]
MEDMDVQKERRVHLPIVGKKGHGDEPASIETILAEFEAEQRKRLGLDQETKQWKDDIFDHWTASQRQHTTMLCGGLTIAQDYLISGALEGIGYRVLPLEVSDNAALNLGKEFGNRGQCNPTYFTVGNLLKHLFYLRDVKKVPVSEIIERYVFVTAGACGPCRFGTYITEFRKALRDAGFEGFRVLLFQQQGGLSQATEEAGLNLNAQFFYRLVLGIMLGDALNALVYRLRPYEKESGATNRAMEQAKKLLFQTLRNNEPLFPALFKVRSLFKQIEVDRLRVKPKVSVIGEFWAMTTEGDGNYELQRFLEGEGAEVDIQIVTNWLLYNIWEHVYDTKERLHLRKDDRGRRGLAGSNPSKKLAILWVADRGVRLAFQAIANSIGLSGYKLSDMDEVAEAARELYNNHLRGGEGHMEVGKLVLNAAHKKSTMTLSVKPFGCMPSSGVSDGVQSYVTEKYPEAIFLPIETSGDGKVNVHSRVQMMLFKARQTALAEFRAALEKHGVTEQSVRDFVAKHPRLAGPLFHPDHFVTHTAADMVHHVAPLMKQGYLKGSLKRLWERLLPHSQHGAHALP